MRERSQGQGGQAVSAHHRPCSVEDLLLGRLVPVTAAVAAAGPVRRHRGHDLTLADNAAIILTVFGFPKGRWEFAMAGTTAVGAGVAVPLGHRGAMILAETEFDRIAAQVRGPAPRGWAAPAGVGVGER